MVAHGLSARCATSSSVSPSRSSAACTFVEGRSRHRSWTEYRLVYVKAGRRKWLPDILGPIQDEKQAVELAVAHLSFDLMSDVFVVKRAVIVEDWTTLDGSESFADEGSEQG